MRNKYKGADIKARLGSTVIRYRGIPYYCDVDGETCVLLDLVSKRRAHLVSAEDPELDISSMTLGYVNVTHPAICAVYLERMPARRYKQGIDLAALHFTPLVKPASSFGVSGNDMFCQGFIDSYQDVFPTVPDALQQLTSRKVLSVALSKKIALLREGDHAKVYQGTQEIGFMKLGTFQVNIPKTETSWLQVYELNDIPGWKVVEGLKASA